MGRLIDADKLIGVLLTENQRCITSTGHELTMNMIVSFVNNQPTAYDVEKVVEEIEEAECASGALERKCWLDKVIDAVRKGGVE